MRQARIAALAAALLTVQASPWAPAQAADLSPAHWPAAERAQLEAAEAANYPDTVSRPQSRGAMVSATMSPVAVHAGMEALRQGGTAADAAVATALTQVEINLNSFVSYAGIAELVYYEAKTGKVYAMDAGWAPYAGEKDPASIPLAETVLLGAIMPPAGAAPAQGRQTLVPGFMAGMAAAHSRFGRLPFASLFEPAIWYAEHGVPASRRLMSYYPREKAVLSRTPEGRAYLAQGDEAQIGPDRRIRTPEVAALLRHVARQGPGYMYRGPWAQRFVDQVRAAGGAATLEDLANYKVAWETPLSARFGDATVWAPGAGNNSACAVLQSLALLDALGGRKLAPYWRDADSFAAYTRAIKIAFAQAYMIQEDPENACPARLTAAYAQAEAPQLPALVKGLEGGIGTGHHSASVVAIDRWGNVAALVHTINGEMTALVVDGVPLGAPAAGLQSRIAATPPGGHVAGDMAPVIALRNGKPVAAVASIGTSLHGETVRMTAGLLSGIDPVMLGFAPPLLNAMETAHDTSEPLPQGAYRAEVRAGIAALGVPLREVPRNLIPLLRGDVAFATLDPGGDRRTAEVPVVPTFADGR